MTAQLAPNPTYRAVDNNGNALVGGLVYSYIAGTSTPQATYTDYTQGTPNTNPVVLNARGECALWLDPTKSYKINLTDAAGNQIPGYPVDQINGILSPNSSIIPSVDNVYTLGSPTLAWADAYLGAYHLSVLSGIAPSDVRRYGYVGNGTADDTTAINAAITALAGRGVVNFPPYTTTARVTSQIVLPNGVFLQGAGFSELNGTGSANRGATCILRGFTGASPTILASGNDCGMDGIDIDNNLQGTGDCIDIWGSRFRWGAISTRNSGGEGLRIGKSDGGASTINANAWSGNKLITCGNSGAGMRLDDTNTTTSLSYPLGASNANSGFLAHLDARSNGTDGLQLGNANDNVFGMVVSQSNTGCGIRFKTDGTNWGPRCNKILGNDCESNTGNDIQIDAGTLPASGPGGYNVIWGNRSIALNSRIVDNSTGSLVMQWTSGLANRAYNFGSDLNIVNFSGNGRLNFAVGANGSQATWYALPSSTTDSMLRAQVHVNGGSLSDAMEINQHGVVRPYLDLVAAVYNTTVTVDASAGNIQSITVTNGTGFTMAIPTNPVTSQTLRLTFRNTSGGAVGAVTWTTSAGGFKLVGSAMTMPANGNSRTIQFHYDGTNWIEDFRGAADVPN